MRPAFGSVVSILQSDLRRALDVLLSITQSVSLFAQIIAYFFGLFLLSPIMCLVCAVLMLLVMLASGGQFREIRKRGGAMTNVNQIACNLHHWSSQTRSPDPAFGHGKSGGH